jgi:site-specific recombinase XerD
MKSMPSAHGDIVMPNAAELAALRAWYEGLGAKQAVVRYLGHNKADGQSSRGMLGTIRRRLMAFARSRGRDDLAQLFVHPDSQRSSRVRSVLRTIELLPSLASPQPLIGDEIAHWLEPRAVRALEGQGIKTLAALTLRIPRRKMWWTGIAGLGAAGARRIEEFFAQHPELTARARDLVVAPQELVPWERLAVPAEVDGSRGSFRAPHATCILGADNDYEAVQAWLSLHESPATERAYRKEAERLILWAIVERGRALSSLTTEDAIAYRAFLRRPSPHARWVGPARPRSAADWRPFAGGLSPKSIAYSLSVLGALFRWLIQQRYVLANPFAGLKVRGASRGEATAVERVFSESEWSMVQTISEGLEWSYGWEPAAAHRLRFMLDFAYATGLRVSELVSARLGSINCDDHGDVWLHVVGKGAKAAKVAVPPLGWSALQRYLAQRRLPTDPQRWDPQTPLVGCLVEDSTEGITAARLWAIMKRFFSQAADIVQDTSPSTADKLRRASTHWMRHTHATHALALGVELTIVRDNLRHASLSTTSIYLHTDEAKRATQMRKAFGAR